MAGAMDDFMSNVNPEDDSMLDATQRADAEDAIRSLDDTGQVKDTEGTQEPAPAAASEQHVGRPLTHDIPRATNPYAAYAEQQRMQEGQDFQQVYQSHPAQQAYQAQPAQAQPAQPQHAQPQPSAQTQQIPQASQPYQTPQVQSGVGANQRFTQTAPIAPGAEQAPTQQYPAQPGAAFGSTQRTYGSQYAQPQADQQPTARQQIPYINRQDVMGQEGARSARSAAEPVAQERAVSVPPTKKGGASTLKSLLVGLAGGAVSAAAVTLALSAMGVGGKTNTIALNTTDSSAGQTIKIDANTEDATIAQAAAAKALPSVASVYVTAGDSYGLGSGVILDTNGNIITNYHVVDGADVVTVTINGKSYDATIVGTDASSDLAVVHAELGGDTVTPMEVGDSDALVVGEWVMTIGSPFGLDQSVSAGIVSSLSRNQMMTSYTGNTLYTNLIQTDASINPGNSGGAMVNSQGQLVGINTLFSSDTESFAGIGFAIPGNYAVDIANKIISGEQVTHAYIGLTMQTVNAQNAQENHLSVNQGAYVAEVAKGSPAEAAGIQEGDIIIALGGEEITSADGMILAVRSHKIGETTTITFMRGSEKMEAEVTFSDDAELQKLQQEQLEQQQEEQGNGLEGMPEGPGQDDSGDVSLDEIFEWLFDNRGGSYEIGE